MEYTLTCPNGMFKLFERFKCVLCKWWGGKSMKVTTLRPEVLYAFRVWRHLYRVSTTQYTA